MPRHLVFLGAPTRGEITSFASDNASRCGWYAVADPSPAELHDLGTPAVAASSRAVYRLPPATLEEASRRISRLYENIIFRDAEEPDGEAEGAVDGSVNDYTRDRTTVITWPPTLPPGEDNDSYAGDRREITFLRPTGSFSRSSVRPRQVRATQESQETNSYSYSYNDSSDASVARFPQFHFSLHSLTSLASLANSLKGTREVQPHGGAPYGAKEKVNVLVAVLEAEGPDTIRIKKGPEAGKEVSLLKLVIGDEEGQVCRLTAWREVAERWGGAHLDDTPVKRGDVVYLQNLVASGDGKNPSVPETMSLTASPTLNSTMFICYRTMPRVPDREVGVNDERFRPDLRLGFSDATVRKVAGVVRWFEAMAGLPHS